MFHPSSFESYIKLLKHRRRHGQLPHSLQRKLAPHMDIPISNGGTFSLYQFTKGS